MYAPVGCPKESDEGQIEKLREDVNQLNQENKKLTEDNEKLIADNQQLRANKEIGKLKVTLIKGLTQTIAPRFAAKR